MGFLSKIARAVGKAARPNKLLGAATKPAVKAATKIRGTIATAAGAAGKTVGTVAPVVPGAAASSATRKTMADQTLAQNAVIDKTAVQQADVAPVNPLSAMADPAIAQAAEADRKRKLGVRATRGQLRRTILG